MQYQKNKLKNKEVEKMYICKKCGQQVPDNSVICNRCGEFVNRDSSQGRVSTQGGIKGMKNWQIFLCMVVGNLIFMWLNWLFGGIILAIVAVISILWIKDKQPKTIFDIIVTVLAVMNGFGAIIYMFT